MQARTLAAAIVHGLGPAHSSYPARGALGRFNREGQVLWREEMSWTADVLLGVATILLLRHYKLPETVTIVSTGVVSITVPLILSSYFRYRNRQ
jgi:hypothetical protein